ncbi:hypothetical protein GON03_05555 [Nocardioides sp. MAH-18]|uniref:Secreted protein n=1 Tax=Nocardioides agri TaxID=2682843 RepID=A0A6L6XN00_9ACTN|nr:MULTISPECIES: HAD domain-containing protein [unclassified Nocardioides]MBA2953774.1 hypothetical protein [Nocardioides sp. CGMCC 1.13656]MVQ48639.1 hypothetical protein [Nocardioides sp. MAH-18]
MTNRVPLLLDVDGVVNVFGAGVDELRDRGFAAYDATSHDGYTYRLHVAPETPGLIAELAESFEIVWCTTWRNANDVIAPLLGLPGDLRQVWFPSQWLDVPFGLCRKTPMVAEWAREHGIRRLAWLDDEISESDTDALSNGWQSNRGWLTIEPLDDVLLLQCDPGVGLTREHTDRLRVWE